jgi:hypothetical protein
MRFNDNPAFYATIGDHVSRALHDSGIVNVAAIALELRRQAPSENIYDIERAVLGYATLIGAPVVFERALTGGFDEPVWDDNDGLLIEIVEGDPGTLND